MIGLLFDSKRYMMFFSWSILKTKRLSLTLLALICFISGCSGISGRYMQDIGDYQYTKANQLDTYLKGSRCIGVVEFYAPYPEPTKSVVSYKILNSSTCATNANIFMMRQCNGSEVYSIVREGRHFCADKDERPLYAWKKDYDTFQLFEPIKGRERGWYKYASSILRFETSDELIAREKMQSDIAISKAKQMMIKYKKLIQGEPEKIRASQDGKQICKLAGDRERVVSGGRNPAYWEFYVGNIERQTGDKILVRYVFHGSKFIQYDDANNLVRWEDLNGWYLCD
ncbi:TPA: hypothetical protein JG870_003426 [Enterobacter hormaechei subsp. steigerwaltii]|nr:hypothetical protein [Enterobacter hormaechei subsp. steigerwaltii]